MVRMSKRLYISLWVVTFALLFLCGIPALFLLDSYAIPRGMGIDDDLTNLFVGSMVFLAVVPFLLTQTILIFVVIYKMWAAIQDERSPRMSPGKAIGFLFIPFFNLYWIFQVWGGFPTDYNRYLEHHALPLPRLSQGLYVTYAILVLLCAIPFLGLLVLLIASPVFITLAAKTSDAVNRLADAKERMQVAYL